MADSRSRAGNGEEVPVEPGSPALQVDSLPAELQGKPYAGRVLLNSKYLRLWKMCFYLVFLILLPYAQEICLINFHFLYFIDRFSLESNA